MGNETQIFGSKGTLTLSNSDEKLYFAKAGQSFEDISVDDPNASLDGLNKGIWNVSVLAALQELVGAIIEGRSAAARGDLRRRPAQPRQCSMRSSSRPRTGAGRISISVRQADG